MIEDNRHDEISDKGIFPVTNQYETDEWVDMDGPEKDQRCEGDVSRQNRALVRILSLCLRSRKC